jgi:hypothetical protein
MGIADCGLRIWLIGPIGRIGLIGGMGTPNTPTPQHSVRFFGDSHYSLFQLHYSWSWDDYGMVLKKAHPYGTDDFLVKKRGFYPA